MTYFRAGFVVLTGFLVYGSAHGIISHLPEIYLSFGDDARQADETYENLKELKDNKIVDQGLSWILATFATAAVGVFTKGDSEADSLASTSTQTTSSGQPLSEKEYVDKVVSRHDKLRGKHKELREAYSRIARRLHKTRAIARRRAQSGIVIMTAVLFAVACMVASGIELLVALPSEKALATATGADDGSAGAEDGTASTVEDDDPASTEETKQGLERKLLATQSAATALFALLLGCFSYRRYIRRTGHVSFGSAFYIGCIGIAAAPFLGTLVRGPETWALILGSKSFVLIGETEVPVVVYQAAARLLVYPLIGLIGCGLAVKTTPRQIAKAKASR